MVEFAIIALATTSTAIAAYGWYQAGKAAEQQAKAEAAWHDYNAKVAQREAEAERQAAAFEAKQQRREAKQLLARQRALIGKAGVTMEGSPLLVAEDTAAQLALENYMIRMTGARRAAAYESQSILDVSKAGAARARGAAEKRAGIYQAGASILGGAADIGYAGYGMGVWGKKKTTSTAPTMPVIT